MVNIGKNFGKTTLKIYNNPELCDYTIQFRSSTLFICSSIVAVHSQVFECMFRVDMKEKKDKIINLDEDVNFEHIDLIFKYMHSGIFNFTTKNLVICTKLMHKYQIVGFDKIIKKIPSFIDNDNCFDYLIHLQNADETTLKLLQFVFDTCIDYVVMNIKNNWIEAEHRQEKFLKLNSSLVKIILEDLNFHLNRTQMKNVTILLLKCIAHNPESYNYYFHILPNLLEEKFSLK